MNGFYFILSGLGTQQGDALKASTQNDMLSSYPLVPTMFLYPDFILILFRCYPTLIRFYPNFIQVLSWFYLDFIQTFRNSLYPSFILILTLVLKKNLDTNKNLDKI